MATIRSVPKPESRTCECGERMRPAVRYEATRHVAVWWCLDGCGAETPGFYDRHQPEPASTWCRYCGVSFVQADPRQRYCTPDHADRAGRITLDRRSSGRAMRVRRPA